jgi:hypothetical protein
MQFKSEAQVVSYLKYKPKIHYLTVCYETNPVFKCKRGEGGDFAFFTVDTDEKVTKVCIVVGFIYKISCFLHHAIEPVPASFVNALCNYIE